MEVAVALIGGALVVLLSSGIAALARLSRRIHRRSEELQATSSRMQAVVTSSLDAVVVADAEGLVVEFNRAAEETFGYARDEVIGRPMSDAIIPHHLRAAHDAGMARYRATRRKRAADNGRIELQGLRKSGEVFPLELAIATAQSDEGELFVSFLRDITERKAAEAELTAARDRAVAGDKAKARLLAVMSHEMRTPLNGMLGTMELLKRSELDPQQAEYLSIMEYSGEILLHHVNDVLDISRIDAGTAAPQIATFSLCAKLRRLVELHQPLAAVRDNTLTLEIGPGLDMVAGDAQRLRQVVVNLVSNAVKFTSGGRVELCALRVEDSDMVEISVRDTGIGIAPEDQARIFEEFYTADATYGREVEGTGLGLAITERQVRLLGGEITLDSVPGMGSLFTVRLPLPAAAPVARPAEATEPARRAGEPLDILLVEDNRVNRFVARRILERLGHRVTEANDGLAGVEAAGLHGYDAILMDISMPRLDGTEATRRIRAAGPSRGARIVALTAHAMPDEIEGFRAAGMDEVATKPVSSAQLAEILGDASGIEEADANGDAPRNAPLGAAAALPTLH